MSVLIYVGHSPNSYRYSQQVEACRQLAAHYMLSPDGPPQIISETLAGNDQHLRAMFRHLGLGDVVLVPAMSAFGDRPSVVLEAVAKITSAGSRIFSVEHSGEVNPVEFRKYTQPWIAFEDDLTKAEDKLRDERQKHRQELETYGNEVREQVIGVMLKRGVNLVDLLNPDTAKPLKVPSNPALARSLKSKREQLGLTQAQAGELVLSLGEEKAINQSDVSKYENTGEGKGIEAYELALNFRLAMQSAAAKQPEPDATGEVIYGGQPVTEAEALIAGVLNG